MVLKYKAATAAGTLLLMLMGRDELLKNNLNDNGHGVRTGENVKCDSRSKIARTEDGTCNDQQDPLMGAAKVPLGRNVSREVIIKNQDMLMEPNPIEVSRELFTRKGETKVLPLNLFLTAWIQFENHDWFDHENDEKDYANFYKIKIPEKYQGTFKQAGAIGEIKALFDLDKYMVLPKTSVAGQNKDKNGNAYNTYSNRMTHWWDASQLYGSNAKVSGELRALHDGKMKMDEKTNRLPYSQTTDDAKSLTGFKEGIEKTGSDRNWWTGLALLHNAFVRTHNLVVQNKDLIAEVKANLANPKQELFVYDEKAEQVVQIPREAVFKTDGSVDQEKYKQALDQMLYDKGRLVTAAIIAKIHTVEWTPAVLQTTAADIALRTNWFGVIEGQADKDVDENTTYQAMKSLAEALHITDITEKFTAAGIVGGNKHLNNIPYSLTEEFTSVYRLHSLLPESVNLGEGKDVPIAEMINDKSKNIFATNDLGNLYYSFGRARSGQLTLGNYPKFLQNLNIPVLGKLDMGAVDLIRDRERGVPRYNEFRRQLHLTEITSFADLFNYTSNLKGSATDCLTVDPSLLGFGILGKVIFSGSTSPSVKLHCKLLSMYSRLQKYKETREKLATARFDIQKNWYKKSLGSLKVAIAKDIKEKEAALTPDQAEVVAKLRTLYNTDSLRNAFQKDYQKELELPDNTEALDLLVGTLAESYRYEAEPGRNFAGFGFGDTPFQIFVLMASRRILTDEFLTDSYKPEVYTKAGIAMVSAAGMKGIFTCGLKKEFPQIDHSLQCIRTAFHPWNETGKDPTCLAQDAAYEKREQMKIADFKNLVCPN